MLVFSCAGRAAGATLLARARFVAEAARVWGPVMFVGKPDARDVLQQAYYTDAYFARASGAPAQVSGKRRCRMHGATNRGAPVGNTNARKHGGYSAKTKATVRYVRQIARLVNDEIE